MYRIFVKHSFFGKKKDPIVNTKDNEKSTITDVHLNLFQNDFSYKHHAE